MYLPQSGAYSAITWSLCDIRTETGLNTFTLKTWRDKLFHFRLLWEEMNLKESYIRMYMSNIISISEIIFVSTLCVWRNQVWQIFQSQFINHFVWCNQSVFSATYTLWFPVNVIWTTTSVKRTFWHVYPAKIPIRLRIREAWEESSRRIWIAKDANVSVRMRKSNSCLHWAHRSEGTYSHVAALESLPMRIQEDFEGDSIQSYYRTLHIRTDRPEQTE